MGILDGIWLGIGYSVARVILPLVSFGKMRAGPLKELRNGYGWLGCRRSEAGHLELEPLIAGGIGLIVCCLGLALFLNLIW